MNKNVNKIELSRDKNSRIKLRNNKFEIIKAAISRKDVIKYRTGVLAGVVHGSHPGRLLGACTLLETIVDQRSQREFHIRLDHIGIQRIVQRNLFSGINNGLVENRQFRGFVRDYRLELVVVHFAGIIFKSTGQDGASDLGSVSELGRQTTDFATNGQDLLSEQPEMKVDLQYKTTKIDEVEKCCN